MVVTHELIPEEPSHSDKIDTYPTSTDRNRKLSLEEIQVEGKPKNEIGERNEVRNEKKTNETKIWRGRKKWRTPGGGEKGKTL